MAGLQRSATSFRRQGSSGLVWDDRFLSGELVFQRQEQQQQERDDQDHKQVRTLMKEIKTKKRVGSIGTTERSRYIEAGRHEFKAGKVSPDNDEPPSPRLSACGFWDIFGKKGDKAGRKRTGGKRRRR